MAGRQIDVGKMQQSGRLGRQRRCDDKGPGVSFRDRPTGHCGGVVVATGTLPPPPPPRAPPTIDTPQWRRGQQPQRVQTAPLRCGRICGTALPTRAPSESVLPPGNITGTFVDIAELSWGFSYFEGSVIVGCMVTAEDIARELKVSGRKLRGFLRKTMPRSESEKHQPWLFSRVQADQVKREFHGHFGNST